MRPGPGAPGTFTAEQIVQIINLACRPPEQLGRPVTAWTPRELADEAVKQGIVATHLAPHGGAFFKGRPICSRTAAATGSTPRPRHEDPAAFAEQVETICTVYAYAPMLEALGCHVVSTDEMTGIQALERAAPTKPMRPGCPERREHEYIRHGTLSLIATFNVATGAVLAPSLGPTRTEADFAAHIAQVLDTDPDAASGSSSPTTSTPTNPRRWSASSPTAAGSPTTSA